MNQKTTQQIYPELPEWSKRDDLGDLVPSEVRQALRAYADETCEARAAAASKPQVKEARERRRWLSDSFNRGTQTLDEATVSARAMAASMLVPRAALATPAQGTIPDPDDPWHGYPWFENTRAALAAPAQAVPASVIMASVMRDDGGEHPAFCLMVAYRAEKDAKAALAMLTDEPALDAQNEVKTLLRKYRNLCLKIGRGDSQHIARIDAAIAAQRGGEHG